MKTVFSKKSFKLVLASMTFAASLVLSIMLPMYSERFDGTARLELAFLLAFGAVMGFSELFCMITGFGRAKYAALSVALCAVLTVINTFTEWLTFIGLTEKNSREIYGSFLSGNIILHVFVLAAAVAFGCFVIHRNSKPVAEK